MRARACHGEERKGYLSRSLIAALCAGSGRFFLQHLTEEPRRIVKVVLVMRTPNALSETVAAGLGAETAVFAERSSTGAFSRKFAVDRVCASVEVHVH